MKRKLLPEILLLCTLGASVVCSGCQPSASAGTAAPIQTDAGSEATASAQAADSTESNTAGEAETSAESGAAAPANTLVFQNGASFTGMIPLLNEHSDDGTYRYETMTEDTMTVIVNTALSADSADRDLPEACLIRILTAQGDGSARDFSLSRIPSVAGSADLPAYRIAWINGYNEDTRTNVGIAVLSDSFTYLYYFNTAIDYFGEVEDLYEDVLSGLELNDPEAAPQPRCSFEGTIFHYNGRDYDLAEHGTGANAILSCDPVGSYLVITSHLNPDNNVYSIFDTRSETFGPDIIGCNYIVHSNDITTMVYSSGPDLFDYDGNLLVSLWLSEGSFIRELSFADDYSLVNITIETANGYEYASVTL